MKYNILSKITTYHIINAFIGFLVFWLVTDNIKYGIIFGIFEIIYKPFQFNIHEKIWNSLMPTKKPKEIISSQPMEIKKEEPIQIEPTQIEPIQIKSNQKKVLTYNSSR